MMAPRLQLIEALQAESPDLDVHAMAADIATRPGVKNPDALLISQVKAARRRRDASEARRPVTTNEAKEAADFFVSVLQQTALHRLSPGRIADRLACAKRDGFRGISDQVIALLRKFGSAWPSEKGGKGWSS
jgi:hypothetical protein